MIGQILFGLAVFIFCRVIAFDPLEHEIPDLKEGDDGFDGGPG